ncbi:hypothetical protein BDZ97DRAFT_1925075 [Flammula alnicola]|nr:hypothetical protein BDZ97DRAFT_1925075 [Flammula alnicola]
MSTALTRFLLSHPTLRDLHLAYIPEYEDLDQLDPTLITKDMLPNLRSLRAHPSFVQMLASGGCNGLNNMTSLSIVHGLHDELKEAVDVMLHSLLLLAPDGLPNVKNLKFYLRDIADDSLDDFVGWMGDFSKLFPRIETWTGDLPNDITLSLFTQVLSGFPYAREFEIEGWPEPEPNGSSKMDAIRAISSHFQFLEQVKFRRPDGTLADILRISRYREGYQIFSWVEDVEDT